MSVPDDVREALVETGLRQSQATRTDVELIVDSVLAHLEQVGYSQQYLSEHYGEPLYRIRKERE